MGYYDYLKSKYAMDADDTTRRHRNGTPCNAKSEETCPEHRKEAKRDEMDVVSSSPTAGGAIDQEKHSHIAGIVDADGILSEDVSEEDLKIALSKRSKFLADRASDEMIRDGILEASENAVFNVDYATDIFGDPDKSKVLVTGHITTGYDWEAMRDDMNKETQYEIKYKRGVQKALGTMFADAGVDDEDWENFEWTSGMYNHRIGLRCYFTVRIPKRAG